MFIELSGSLFIKQLWRKTVRHCFVAWCGIRKLPIPPEHQSFTDMYTPWEPQPSTTASVVFPSR
ncbi:hypothetical protein BDZ89DRAFT_1068829, partial [Hymenopellis radicata]